MSRPERNAILLVAGVGLLILASGAFYFWPSPPAVAPGPDLEEITATDVANCWRRLDQGVARFEIQRWSEAESQFAELQELAPAEPAAGFGLAATAYRAGQNALATSRLAAIDLEVDLDPASAEMLRARIAFAQGKLSYEQGDLASVRSSYARAAEHAPAEAAYHYALAEACAFVDPPDAQAALAGFRAALRAAPENTRIAVELALAAVASADAGVREEGLEALTRAVAVATAGAPDPRLQEQLDRGRAAVAAGAGGSVPGGIRIASNLLRATQRFQQDARALADRMEIRPITRLLSSALARRPSGASPLVSFDPGALLPTLDMPVISSALVLDALEPDELPEESPVREAGLLALSAGSLSWLPRWSTAQEFVRIETEISSPARDVITGDLDGDGLMEAIVLDADGIRVLDREAGVWRARVADHALASAGAMQRGLLVDFDHDGFLDLLAIAATAGGEGESAWTEGDLLLIRNAEAAALSAPVPFPLEERGEFSHVAAGDLDDDGDLDLVLARGGEVVFARNDRQARFALAGRATLPGAARIDDLAVADLDADGYPETLAIASGALTVLAGAARSPLATMAAVSPALDDLASVLEARDLSVIDLDLDGDLDVLVAGSPRETRPAPCSLAGLMNDGHGGWTTQRWHTDGELATATPLDLDGDRDPDLVVRQSDGQLTTFASTGAEAQGWIALNLRAPRVIVAGAKVPLDAKGVKVIVHSASSIQRVSLDRPGCIIGLGSDDAHLVRMIWPNGMSEYLHDPESRRDHDVLLEIRLEGSCPFLYARTPDGFEFVTDAIGISPLGMLVAVGVHNPLHAEEYLRLPGWVQPMDGEIVLSITEELREVSYFDQVELVAVDAPVGVVVHSAERFVVPPVQGLDLTLLESVAPPTAVVDQRGEDVLDLLAADDHRYLTGFTERTRYQGLVEEHVLEIDLSDAVSRHGRELGLLMVGWLQYGNTSTNVAIDRDHSVDFIRPRLETPDGAGGWKPSPVAVGLPAGKPKPFAIDISSAIDETDPRVRLVTNLEVYWDRIAVGRLISTDGSSREQRLAPSTASFDFGGYSRWFRPASNGPDLFDYSDRRPYPWREDSSGQEQRYSWDELEGGYTRFGEVGELLQSRDDRSVIIGSGEEMIVRFATATLEPPPTGWSRTYFLHSEGWCKDGDFNTAHGQSVEPLPFHDLGAYPPDRAFPDSPSHLDYLESFQTRFVMRDRLHRLAAGAPPRPPAR